MNLQLFELVGTDDTRPFSPYCWRIRMALAHKGLSAQSIPWCFTEKEAIAPHKSDKVPVLLDGEKPVVDSWVIANYLEANDVRVTGASETSAPTSWARVVLDPGGTASYEFDVQWNPGPLPDSAAKVSSTFLSHTQFCSIWDGASTKSPGTCVPAKRPYFARVTIECKA